MAKNDHRRSNSIYGGISPVSLLLTPLHSVPNSIRSMPHCAPRLPPTAEQESKGRLASHPTVVPQLVALLQPGCGKHLQSGVLWLLHNAHSF